jgi:hypothetical protein
MREKMVEIANQAKWQNFLCGVPCVHDVKEFAEEVLKVMPNVKLLPVDWDHVVIPVYDANGNYQTGNSIRVFNEFAIYLDDFPFDIGRINFKDNGARKNKTHTYGVYSRKISNAKYATHREQHHMVLATDVKKAVKNVLKYMMPYTTKELAQAFYEPVVNNVKNVEGKIEREMRSKAEPLVYDHLEIAKELAYLKAQGVQFKSAKFREVADSIGDVVERLQTERDRNVGATFVRIYEVGGQQMFSTQEVMMIKKHVQQLQGSEEGRIEGKPVEEMPEDIVGAVSVLSILSNNQYVQNVGMKMDSNHFWIERG